MIRDIKILMLLSDAYGGYGGISQFNKALIKAFIGDPNIHSVKVFVRIGEINKTIRKGKMFQHSPEKNKILFVFKAIREAVAYQPQVIFCGHIHLLPLAALLSILTHKPCWLHLHGIECWERKKGISWAIAQCARITAVSRYTRERFLSWANYSSNSVNILPDTVDETYQPGSRSESFIRKYNLYGRKVMVSVSRMSAKERYKGFDLVLESMNNLIRCVPNVIYIIIGEGDDRLRLEEKVKKMGLEQYVKFIGRISQKDLLKVYWSSDLFVLPSTGEGFGIVFLEAISCGIPAIGLNSGGVRDVLRDGEFGSLVDKGNLATEIINLLQQPQKNKGLHSVEVREAFGFPKYQNHVKKIVGLLSNEN